MSLVFSCLICTELAHSVAFVRAGVVGAQIRRHCDVIKQALIGLWVVDQFREDKVMSPLMYSATNILWPQLYGSNMHCCTRQNSIGYMGNGGRGGVKEIGYMPFGSV